MSKLKEKANVQAIYMQYLLAKAQKIAQEKTNKNELPFDPQGRVLVDVTLDNNDWDTIAEEINQELKEKISVAVLKKEFGSKTDTTTVSLDISNTSLQKNFQEDLRTHLDKVLGSNVKKNNKKRMDTILSALDGTPKGSIIALQQEFHFHLGLAARVYLRTEEKFKDKEAEMKAAHEAAARKVNHLVLSVYAKALEKATDSKGNLNIEVLNKALDKARKSITPQAHTILRQEVVRHTGVIPTQLKKSSLKHAAEATTATANDVLHTDNQQHLATLIKGSENTAHHRIAGKEFAHRQLITHTLTKEANIKSHSHPRIQIRTPSPVVKKGLKEEEYIADVAEKLAQITLEYSLKENLSDHSKKIPKAFIYNRYTAINDSLGDSNGNLQTQSARHILKGAHDYNAAQMKEGDPVFCLVQGISINGFGDHLGYSGDELIIESTLMTEMALLHTLYEASSPEQKESIEQVFEKYKSFLQTRTAEEGYFSQSTQGQEAISAIQAIKKGWQKELSQQVAPDLFASAQSGLKKLIANNLHFSHEHACPNDPKKQNFRTQPRAKIDFQQRR